MFAAMSLATARGCVLKGCRMRCPLGTEGGHSCNSADKQHCGATEGVRSAYFQSWQKRMNRVHQWRTPGQHPIGEECIQLQGRENSAHSASKTRGFYFSQHKTPKGRQLLALVPWPGKFKAHASGIILSFPSLVTGGLPQLQTSCPPSRQEEKREFGGISCVFLHYWGKQKHSCNFCWSSTLVPWVRTVSLGHPWLQETRKTNILPVLGHTAAPKWNWSYVSKEGEMDTREASSMSITRS